MLPLIAASETPPAGGGGMAAAALLGLEQGLGLMAPPSLAPSSADVYGLADLASRSGLPYSDAKTMLNTFCQKICKATISKEDIVYTCTKFSGKFQATVTLNCLQGVQIAGELGSSPKEAEQSAATLALHHHSAEIEALPAMVKFKGVKRKAVDGDDPTILAQPEGGPGNARGKLNAVLMKLFHRPLTKEDIVYSTVQTSQGFQATLSIPRAPGDWGGLAWVGDVSNRKKDAEESAAAHGLQALYADPDLATEMSAPPPEKKQYGGKKGGGKGYKGKGKGKDWGAGKGMDFMFWKGQQGFGKGSAAFPAQWNPAQY